jgi:serine protease Do
VVAHGTGFGLRQSGNDTLIVTGRHLAEWPAVTDEDHTAEDVPVGCRRVSDTLRIVGSEQDDYERDDVPLARVVSDPQLDVAVLRARALLPVMPWKIGRSSALRERNSVEARGFPLGALRANIAGQVVSAYEHHDDGGWDHDDFVVDVPLSQRDSGAPVFAISCRTREFELVGVYHASYSGESALDAVVGVDQWELFRLKRAETAKRQRGARSGRPRGSSTASVRVSLLPLCSLVAAVRRGGRARVRM